MSFTQKALAVDFSLARGRFQGGGNSYTAKGLRMSARITTPGGEDVGNLALAIYGMTESEMNALTYLPFAATAVGQNTVTVRAGDAPNPQAVAFNGTITAAYADGTRQPDVCFRVEALGAHVERIKPVPAVSLPGSQDVATLMGQLAQSMGRTLENNGIDSKIQNPNLPGSALQQVAALARAAGIMWTLEKDTLAIWKPGQARQGSAVQISKATGLVGYPAFTSSGILVTTEFQGTLKFGCKINVQSGLQPACGDWFVKYMEHALDSMTPGGSWFSTLEADRIRVDDNE